MIHRYTRYIYSCTFNISHCRVPDKYNMTNTKHLTSKGDFAWPCLYTSENVYNAKSRIVQTQHFQNHN